MALDNRDYTTEYVILGILTDSVEPKPSIKRCIYKVPEYLRKGNEDAYTPRLISIGPIHRKNVNLYQMERQKVEYFQDFRQRLSNDQRQDLEAYTAWLGVEELNIRSHYSEKCPDLDKNEFVRMILMDAVFIMELFLRKWKGVEETARDYLFENSWIEKSIEVDLLLVENQIPFSVLEKLHVLVLASHDEGHQSFLELACNYFKTHDPYPTDIDTKNQKLRQEWDKPNHFTDLIRSFHIPYDLSYGGENGFVIITTATKLKEAGLNFTVPDLKRCLLDVKFDKNKVLNSLCCLLWCIEDFQACLQIPKLYVDGSVEYILRNLMAFEQCHYPKHHHVCSYVALLNNLIHTEEDVEVLVESKVIEYERGCDKDLAVMITSLAKNVILTSTCYGPLRRDLDKYPNCWNNTTAKLKLVYSPDIWRATGTIVGLVIFVFAVVNVYKTIRDLRRHS